MSDERDGPFEAQDEEEEDAPPEAASAVDRKSQKRIRNKAKREAEEARLFWRSVFATPVGRREVWAILDSLHAFDQRFATGPNGFPQETATWYYRGEHDAGFRIFRSLEKLDMAGVALMRKEHDPFLAEPPRPRRRRDPEDIWR